MSETVNQEIVTTNAQEPKTFTQEELDNIVKDRLAREKQKYEGIDLEDLKRKASEYDRIEEANKTELEKANERANSLQAALDSMKKANEVREMREKVANEAGIPMNLLTGETEDECKEQAKAIMDFANINGYPTVKDSGEITKTNKASTRQQFAAWAEQAFS